MPKLPASTSQDLVRSPQTGSPSPRAGSFAERVSSASPEGRPDKLLILLDCSGSMSATFAHEGGPAAPGRPTLGSRLDAAKAALSAFLQTCDRAQSAIGLLAFSDGIIGRCGLTTTYATIIAIADPLYVDSSTDLAFALGQALEQSPTRLLIISDGMPNSTVDAYRQADQLKLRNIPADCIYIGSDEAGEAFMRHFAELTGGHFFTAADFSSLQSAMLKLEARQRLALPAPKGR